MYGTQYYDVSNWDGGGNAKRVCISQSVYYNLDIFVF